MNRYRNLLGSLVLALLPGHAVPGELREFSTSMDFDEFEVVMEHLRRRDAQFAEELASAVADFKASATVGATQRLDLASGKGYLTLEREDEYAFSVGVWAVARLHADIDAAYESAAAELGI